MDLLPAIDVTASALNAEKTRLEVISQNIANINTTRGPDGKPYKRKIVSFEAQIVAASPGAQPATGVRVAEIKEDTSPGQRVFNPAHPHADASGMVELPNVSLATEMVDMIAASRTYEANLAVVRTSRQLAQMALKIGH